MGYLLFDSFGIGLKRPLEGLPYDPRAFVHRLPHSNLPTQTKEGCSVKGKQNYEVLIYACPSGSIPPKHESLSHHSPMSREHSFFFTPLPLVGGVILCQASRPLNFFIVQSIKGMQDIHSKAQKVFSFPILLNICSPLTMMCFC